MGKEFEIDAYRKGREMLVVLRGRLILSHSPDVKTRLQGLFNPQIDQVYLHLRELDFLDSAGLGVLVGLKMTANKNRTRLTFLNPNSRVADIFRVSKLDTIFEVRSGAEAEVISATLCRDENAMWRDRKDSNQARFHTEYEESSSLTREGFTQMPGAESTEDDQTRRARQLCGNAVEYIRQGDYERAIEAYQAALAIDSDNLSVLNNLAIVYEKRSDWYPMAVDTWNRVLNVSQNRSDQKHASRARSHLDSLSKLMRAD